MNQEDRERVATNKAAVKALLLSDYQEHLGPELDAVGGSEAKRRFRELRSELSGQYLFTVRRVSGGTYGYRMQPLSDGIRRPGRAQ